MYGSIPMQSVTILPAEVLLFHILNHRISQTGSGAGIRTCVREIPALITFEHLCFRFWLGLLQVHIQARGVLVLLASFFKEIYVHLFKIKAFHISYTTMSYMF